MRLLHAASCAPWLGLFACGLDWSHAPSKSVGDGGDRGSELDGGIADAPDAELLADAGEAADAARDARVDDPAPADAGEAGTPLGDAAADSAVIDPPDASGPPLPPEGLVLWLRADRGLELSEAGTAQAWIDQVSGQRAGQPLPDFQPLARLASSGAPPALVFDGTNDFLGLPGVSYDFSEGFTLLVVENNLDTQGDVYQPFFELSNGQEVDDLSFGRYRRQLLVEIDVQAQFNDVIPAGKVQLVSARMNSNRELDTRRDGAPLSTYALDHLPATVRRDSALIGASLYRDALAFGGELYEVAIYTRALSDATLAEAEQAMRARWRCCGQLP